MRILLVSHFFPPQNAVASLRTHAFAAAWAARGQDVTVLTTVKRPDQRGLDLAGRGFEVVELPYRLPRVLEIMRRRYKRASGSASPAGEKGAPDRLRDRTGILGAVRMPAVTGRWVRPALHWALRTPPWDVVVSSAGPYTAHLVALGLKRRGRAARWVADFRDLWVDNHLYRGLFPFTVRERSLQRACLSAADRVWTVSDELAGTLRARTRAPVDVVFNGFDRTEIETLPAGRAFDDDGRVRLVYTGTFYRAGQDPRPLLRALAALRAARPETASRLQLVVAGTGHDQWLRLAEETGVADLLDARPPVDRSTALCLQRDADGLVLLDWSVPDAGVLTGKLFEYLAATAPILQVGGDAASSMGRIVSRSRRGVSLGADERRIRDTLAGLVVDPKQVHQEPDHEYIDGFDRRRQALHALDLMSDMASRSGS